MGRTTIRHIIISFIALVIGTGILSVMVYVVHKKELVLQEQRIAVHKQLQQEEAFRKLERLADASKADRDSLSQYFLHKESDSIDVLTLVEGMAPKAGVTLETKGLQKVSDKDTKTDWIEISFDFSGKHADVERFLAILERLPYLSYMTSVNLNQQDIDYWRAVVTMRVYISNHDNK
jgi:hypothetical protein